MKVITTSKVDPTVWDRFVESHPGGSVYHHSLWHEVIRKTYGHQPLYHLGLDESSNLRAASSSVFVNSPLTGKRIVAYPFSDSCDPLVQDRREAAAILQALENTRSELGASSVELRFAGNSQLFGAATETPEYFNYLLPLSGDPQAVFQTFHRSCIQRAIRNGQKESIEIHHGEAPDDLVTFYRLHLLTRRKHGVPVQPFRFFRNLWNAFAPVQTMTLLLAYHQGKPLAAIILLWFKDVAYYKFGASDDHCLNLRANQLLMWEAIQLAIRKGCTVFDLGRTSSTNIGLCQYKSRWGARQTPLHSLTIPESTRPDALSESSRKHALLKRLISRMPLTLIRLSGELFYKHFA